MVQRSVSELFSYVPLVPDVRIHVVTNDAALASDALSEFVAVDGVSLSIDVPPPAYLSPDPHRLTWYHREIFALERSLSAPLVSSSCAADTVYLYLEDDISLPLPNLLHWHTYADAVYTSLSLVLSFYRVDGDPAAPSYGYLTDQFEDCDGESWGDLRTSPTRVELPRPTPRPESAAAAAPPPQVFLQLWNPYSACYALTSKMLSDFMSLPGWDLVWASSPAGRASVGDSNPLSFGTRELAAAGMQFDASLRTGAGEAFRRSAAVVPFSDEEGLDKRARVFHLDGGIDGGPNWCWHTHEMRRKSKEAGEQEL